MEMLAVLSIVFIGILFIGSIMGMTSAGRISKLEKQNRNLNERVKALESGNVGAATRAPTPAPVPKPQASIAAPVTPEPKPVPKLKPVPEMGLQPPRMAAAAAAAPVKTPSKPESWSPPTPPKPKHPSRSLEEIIGGQWSVWVGGLALLVGAVLLIRFSIEAGFFGPGARILMALGLGAALIAAGEWLKRSDDKVLKGKLGQGKLGEATRVLQSNASVPGLLSAVGIFTLLGTTYAAHELYGFISAPAAFIALGVISLGAMALSLRQGPLLAAIGLLASFATPLLIQTETPNFMALVGYLLVIGLAALALARRTDWKWLETGVVFGWLFWLWMSVDAATVGQLPLWSLFLAIGFGVTVWLSNGAEDEIKAGELTADLRLQPLLAVVWAVIAALLVSNITVRGHGNLIGSSTPVMILSLGSIAVLCVAAVTLKRQAGHLVIAGVMAAGLGLLSGPHVQIIMFAAATLIVVLLSIREAMTRDINPLTKQPDIFWPVFAVGLGLGSVFFSQILSPANWTDNTHALWALGYAALFAAAAVYLQSKSKAGIIISCLTVGSALAWTVVTLMSWDLSFGLSPQGLTAFLKLSVGAVIAVVAIWRLRLPGARLALLGLTGFTVLFAFIAQFPHPDRLSVRPIFNELWIYLALPTAILGVAGYILHSRKDGTLTDKLLNGIIEAAALAGLALFAVFQIRHLSNGGSVYVDKIGFEELGLQVSTGLCFTLAGLSKRFSGNMVLSKMAEVISYATLAIFAVGSLVGLSPFFNIGQKIEGNFVFNSLTTGLLVPTLLLGLCAWRARGRRADAYVNALGALALAGGMSWVTAMIRYVYNGSSIEIFATRFGDLELWTISAVWLVCGIALLALGVWRKERALRIASGVMIILTVLKAFLIDMAGLEGVLRALSFVGLGLVLIVIGRAYQRFWLTDSTHNQPSKISKIGEEE